MHTDDTINFFNSKRSPTAITRAKRGIAKGYGMANCKYMFLGNNKLSKTSEIGNFKFNNDEIIRVNKTKY